jgi:hypothetical protein
MIRNVDRGYLWAGLGVSVALFVVFKLFYPYPSMVMDSYIYLKAAVLDLGANSFPIGYSKFLQFLINLGCDANAIVWIQFLLLDTACMLFFHMIQHFFQPSRFVTISIWLFLFCNPLLLYMANFLTADTLFTALSLFWVTQLIWIVGLPKPYMIWIHTPLLLLVFAVRYNALYFPLVSLVALLTGRIRVRDKVVAVITPLLLIGGFVLYTRTEMKKLSGVSQFSPFGGWQLANDALYMYGHIYHKESESLKGELGMLDSTVRRYFDSVHRVESLLEYDVREPGFYYSGDVRSPLMIYMYKKYGPDTVFQDFRNWGPMGALYGRYGKALILAHPFAFVRYFVWPNAIRYFYPPAEIFVRNSSYFLRQDEFGRMAEESLGVRTLTVSMDLIQFRNQMLSFYPVFFMLLNIVFILAVLGFFLVGEPKKLERSSVQIIWVVTVLWLCNFLFSITASCIVLRYQVLIMIVESSFGFVLVDSLYSQNKDI